MAVISFIQERVGANWVEAGWAFRQFLDDLMLAHPGDSELAALLHEAEDFGFLYIGNLAPELANRVKSSIVDVAQKILDGTLRSCILEPFNDPGIDQEYLKGLRSLLRIAKRTCIGDSTPDTEHLT